MNRPLVGVLGATGAVGRAAVAALGGQRVRLRLGARNVEPLRALPFAFDAQVMAVDAFGDLAGFCAGCSVVLNCAGPSHRIGDRVAVAALAAGADHVDVAGDDPVYAVLHHQRDQVVVLSAGLQPGLSALFPRWAAAHGPAPDELIVTAGGLDRISPAAAAEYLFSLDGGRGTAMAAWRDGRRAEHALTPISQQELRFFPGRVSAHPYLSTESERLAKALRLRRLDWYNVVAGQQLQLALSRLRSQHWTDAGESEVDQAVERLTRAATVDLAGLSTYHLIVTQMSVTQTSDPQPRAAVLRAADSYRVTGVTGALAVQALLEGRVTVGTHYAADVLDPDAVIDALRQAGVASVELYEEDLVEEGAV